MKKEDTLNYLVNLFIEKPVYLGMGAGKLSARYGTNRETVYRAKDIVRGRTTKLPKILILDIETTPLKAYVWQTQVNKAYISDDAIISKWHMLTWSAKWLGSNEIMSMRVSGDEALHEEDGRIVRVLWNLLDEADIVIAHNGDYFDVPNINTRFIVNGLPPTRTYRTIDTLKIARKQFGFTHNSLNALGKVFGLGEKIETNFDLWRNADRGDDEALIEMEIYNRGDVDLLEKVYLKLRPWVRNHPNIGIYLESDEKVCAICGSEHIVQDGYHYTNTGRYPAYRCNDCGSTNTRSRNNDYPKDKKKNLNAPINR